MVRSSPHTLTSKYSTWAGWMGLGRSRKFSPDKTTYSNADLLPWFWEAQSRHPRRPVSPSLSPLPSLNCHQLLLHPEYRRRPAALRLGDNKTHLRAETGDNQRRVTIKEEICEWTNNEGKERYNGTGKVMEMYGAESRKRFLQLIILKVC